MIFGGEYTSTTIALKYRFAWALSFLIISIFGNLFSFYFIAPFFIFSLALSIYLKIIYFRKYHVIVVISLFFLFLWAYLLNYDSGNQWFFYSLLKISSFFVFVLFVTQGIKIYEWINMLRNSTNSFLSQIKAIIDSSILALSCAITVVEYEYSKSKREKRHARKELWMASESFLLKQTNFITDLFILAQMMTRDVASKYSNWTEVSNTSVMRASLKLHEVYNIPNFVDLYLKVFNNIPISSAWKEILDKSTSNKKVLEIGAGSGRFTKFIANHNCSLVAIESNLELFKILNNGFLTYNNVSTINGTFPQDLSDGDFDVIVLNQNVFIELINEYGLFQTCFYIKRYLSNKGIVILDLVHDLNIKLDANFNTIIKQNLESIGEIEYQYKITKVEGNKVSVVVRLTTNKVVESQYESELRVSFFELEEVLQAFKKNDFKLYFRTEIKDMFTFFPGKMELLAFQLGC